MFRKEIAVAPALLIFSAIHMLQGFALYASTAGLPALAYDGMRALFSVLAALFVAGGATLLLLYRYPLRPSLRRALVFIPAAASAAMAVSFGYAGIWPAALHQGVLALTIALLPWFPTRPQGGLDLSRVALSLAQGLILLAWLAGPSRYGPTWLLNLVILLSLASALAPRLAAQASERPWALWASRAFRVALPLLLCLWSAWSGLLTEALAWAVWSVASLLSESLASLQIEPEAGSALQDLSLETWNWLLTFLVVIISALPGTEPYAPGRVALFVLLLAIYNTAIYLIIPRRRSQRERLIAHLLFMILAMGFVVTGAGRANPGLLTLLAAAVPLATWAVGAAWGRCMLWMTTVLVVIAGLEPWVAGDQTLGASLAHLAVSLLITQVVGRIGLSMILAQMNLVEDLRRTQAEVSSTNAALLRSEARMASLLDIAPSAALAIDIDQRIILFNKLAEETFGYSEQEVLGQPLDLILPQNTHRRHREHVLRFLDDPQSSRTMAHRAELAGRRKNGQVFPVQVGISRVTVDDETIFMAVAKDVTEQRETERRLKESEERFRNAFDNAPIGVGLLTEDGTWLQVNQALSEMVGRSAEELVGSTMDQVVAPADWAAFDSFTKSLAQGEVRSLQAERRYLHTSGRTVWVQESYSVMRSRCGSRHFILQALDITKRKGFEAELVHMAHYDSLTDLVNRRYFRECLEQELAAVEQTGNGGALLFLDVDLFKYVNDTLGHQRGDEILRQIAGLLKERFREQDTVARLGGDEFALILPNTSPDEAIERVEGLIKALRDLQVPTGGASVSLSVSVGITFYPQQGRTPDALLSNADVAMYEAKENGRNTWAAYEPEGAWKQEMEAKLSWERRIRSALQEDRLTLHFQPILDLEQNRITHHEILIRMVGEDGRLIYPGAFLGVAERFGLIQEIDRWVVKNAIRLIGEYASVGHNQTFEVNLSGKTLSDPELLPMIQKLIAAYHVDPSSLVFEITETAAIGDIDQARQFIEAMKGLGCRFALDDVGAGFSSLYFLKHLAVDYVKIDGSFIRNLPNDVADQHLVRALALVSRELGKRTIAEFVENEETLQLLREYGVDYAQGYLIGRPGPLLQF